MSPEPITQKLTQKLLLIDDQPEAHLMLEAIMRTPPPVEIILFKALSMEGGMRIIEEQRPDFCLLDLNLTAELRGPATIEFMRRHIADVLPVLIITGEVEPVIPGWGPGRLWAQARNSGACGFLRKDRYFDPRNREFFLHELSDAGLEFAARKEMNVRFAPSIQNDVP